jgi:hypothetical protein
LAWQDGKFPSTELHAQTKRLARLLDHLRVREALGEPIEVNGPVMAGLATRALQPGLLGLAGLRWT